MGQPGDHVEPRPRTAGPPRAAAPARRGHARPGSGRRGSCRRPGRATTGSAPKRVARVSRKRRRPSGSRREYATTTRSAAARCEFVSRCSSTSSIAFTTRVTSPSGRSGASTRSRERRNERNQSAERATAGGFGHRTSTPHGAWLAAATGVRDNGGIRRAAAPRRTRMRGTGSVVDERREHEHLELALEAAQLGTWNWDEETGRTVWDARLEAMHGMAPGDLRRHLRGLEGVAPPRRPGRVHRPGRSRDGRPRALRAAAPLDLARRLDPLARGTRSGHHRRRGSRAGHAWAWCSTSPSARNGRPRSPAASPRITS